MSNTRKLKGGSLVARAIADKGVEIVFTLSGGFINPILEGLMLHGIRVVNAPHEQIAGHLADGLARVTRQPAVCLVGPEGFANSISAMLEAFGQRSPVIFITGSSTLKRINQGGFKEIDHVRIAEPLTKSSILVTDGKRIPDFIDRAFRVALDGNPGPVHICIPTDILYSSYEEKELQDERPFDYTRRSAHVAFPDPSKMNQLIATLRGAEKPVVVVGNGVWWGNAEEELAKFSAHLSIPVLLVPYHQPLLGVELSTYCGLADVHQYKPAEFALNNADLVLTIGCRLDSMLNFGNPPFIPANANLICVNGSSDEVADNHAADINILGHPKPVLSELARAAMSGTWRIKPDWLKQNQDARKKWVNDLKKLLADEAKSQPLHPLTISVEVLRALGEDDWFVVDGGDTHFWAEMALNIVEFEGKKFAGVLHPGPYSLLGCGVPFGIAVKLKYPQSNVVVLSGDGAYLSGGLSIETAFFENAPITVIVDNNRGLGSIGQQQKRMWDSGKSYATDFRDIPFDRLFFALGGEGETIEDASKLGTAVKRAISCGKPACLNVKSKSVISPLIEALADRRAKASIE